MELLIDKVSFRYDKDYLFKDFNLSIGNGLTFLIGKNNSGKSTLFKIISSNLPYIGNIYIDNKDIKRCNNVMFLSLDYLKTLKGKLNIYLNNCDDKLIDYFDLNEFLNIDINKLSFDIKIKACIVNFICCMDVLLIDNMLCWLDKNDRNKVLKKLKNISKKKIVIIITNNMEDLIYANRIVLLNEGNVVIDDDRDNFFLDKKRLERYKVSLPFLVDLSYNLMLYNIINDVYFDVGKLVDAIWK